jgi:hypothetical protein
MHSIQAGYDCGSFDFQFDEWLMLKVNCISPDSLFCRGGDQTILQLKNC